MRTNQRYPARLQYSALSLQGTGRGISYSGLPIGLGENRWARRAMFVHDMLDYEKISLKLYGMV